MGFGSKLLIGLVVAYILKSVHEFYNVFHYSECQLQDDGGRHCIEPFLRADEAGKWPPVQLRVHFYGRRGAARHQTFVRKEVDVGEPFEEVIRLEIPPHVRRNGSMWAELFLTDSSFEGTEIQDAPWHLGSVFSLTKYAEPQAEVFNLMSNSSAKTTKDGHVQPVAHLRSVLPLNVMSDGLVLDERTIPDDLRHLVYVNEEAGSRKKTYLPLFAVDTMRVRLKDLVEIKPENEFMNLTLTYKPISFGKLRFGVVMEHSMAQFAQFGFGEKDVDDIKGTYAEINFYFLALTVVVATVHLLFDFLTFKNDVSFWKGRKTMVGISTRTLIWRCFSETVVFFYLLDEKSSYLILVPSGIGAVVEFWKLSRALKIRVEWADRRPRLVFGELSEKERQTGAFDMEGMQYLTLIYVPQRSWTSWVIKCLANCVYAFGFLFMLPQLFLNYRLKSVAHLPWRAFMYKAFNTFIDDIFAFIITMPTAHRLACFRDDVVFLIYLYQRFLYPVDRARVNEYGEAFDELEEAEEETKKQK
ncbi:hypothetical protein M3Y99_01204300 [Aphelenchoides fujianensis]|nr:hypothetical protein M3Y99_01204300 [Aphelenchoides fujianensis]